MLFSLKDLHEFDLHTADGIFGEIKGFIIDDFEWIVRYMVVKVGSRHVLLAPHAFGQPDPESKSIPLNIDREKVMSSPEIDPELKLSREMERLLSDYFDWPYYWDADDVPNTLPGDLTSVPLIEMQLEKEDEESIPQTGGNEERNAHLYHSREIFGYSVHASNSNSIAGRLSDIVVNGKDFNILYLVVDTAGGLAGGNRVLVSPNWVEEIDEMDSKVHVDLKSETIYNSPEFREIKDITPDFQERIDKHYRL